MGMFDEIGQGGLDPVGGQGYCVDIAMLIDATGSMSPIINEVKENAMAFCTRFHEVMEVMGKNVDELRIKVIPFRDYAYDGAQAMEDKRYACDTPSDQPDRRAPSHCREAGYRARYCHRRTTRKFVT